MSQGDKASAQSSETTAYAALSLAAVLWGGSIVAQKLALGAFSAVEASALRDIGGLIIVLATWWWQEGRLASFNAADLQDSCYVELYASALVSLPFRRGLKTGFYVNDTDLNDATTGRGDVTNALPYVALRLTFNSLSKVFTAYVDHDGAGNGYQWENFGSFGIAGSGGTITNGNWGMNASGTFYVAVYGFSQGLTITSGQMHADNFFAQTPAAATPALACSLATNTVQLRWPQTAVAYELESTTNLTTGVWTTVTNLVTVVGSTNSVQISVVPPQKFFRLRR